MRRRRLFVAVGVLLLTIATLTTGCVTSENGNGNQTDVSDLQYNTELMDELKINFGSGNRKYVESLTLDIEGEEPITLTPPFSSDPVTEREIRFISPTSAPDSQPRIRYTLPDKAEPGLYDVKVSAKYINGEYVNSTYEDYLEYESPENTSENDSTDSSIDLTARPTNWSHKYYMENNAEIAATLLGTEPINDADVEAEVTKPKGGNETVELERTGEGVYTSLFEMNESYTPRVSPQELQNGSVTRRYNATVTATLPDGSTYEYKTGWEAEVFSAPIVVNQTGVPSVEPGDVAEIELEVASFGARSIEFGVSNLRRSSGDHIIKNRNTSLNTSSNPVVVTQEKIRTMIPVPENAEPGNYTGTVSALVTDSDASVVEPVRIEVKSSE